MSTDSKVVIGQTHGSDDTESVLIGYLLGVEALRAGKEVVMWLTKDRVTQEQDLLTQMSDHGILGRVSFAFATVFLFLGCFILRPLLRSFGGIHQQFDDLGKRLAREVFRRQKVTAALDVVLIPRREMLNAPFASLEADYLAAIQRHARRRHVGSPGAAKSL